MAAQTTLILAGLLLVTLGQSFGQRGPAVPPGPRGPRGPQGPRGPRGGPGPTTPRPPFTWSQRPPREYRLVTNERRDGVGATQGRLEGRLNSTAPWQPMCSYGWYNEQSQVACRMLGFKNGSAVSNYLFPMNESLLHPSTININFRCKGNESALEDCEGDWTPYCGRGSSVAVICNGDNTDLDGIADIRLHSKWNMTDIWAAGRVEIRHRGIWGNICIYGSSWTVIEATVTCRRLGYRHGYVGNAGVVGQANNRNPFWLSNVNCRARTMASTDEPEKAAGPGVLEPGEEDDDRRGPLAPPPSPPTVEDLRNLKTLEECLTAEWGYSERHCSHYRHDATVVCNSLTNRLRDSKVSGLRLVNTTSGEDWIVGQVEVQVEDHWGWVCESSTSRRLVWGDKEARVVCRELGYADGVVAKAELFSSNSLPIWLTGKRCSGEEETINDCGGPGLPERTDCSIGGAGVVCSRRPFIHETKGEAPKKTIRLAGGTEGDEQGNPESGRVEVLYRGQWGPVCDTDWDVRDALMVCRALGYDSGMPFKGSAFGGGKGIPWISRVGCAGTEKDLMRCLGWRAVVPTGMCNESQHAGVACGKCREDEAVSARLVATASGDQKSTGRIEVLYKGQWGTICSDNWDDVDAKVVCRQLGYSGGWAAKDGMTGKGVGMVWLTNINCTGTETSIKDCEHSGWGENSMFIPCTHDRDAGAICHGTL